MTTMTGSHSGSSGGGSSRPGGSRTMKGSNEKLKKSPYMRLRRLRLRKSMTVALLGVGLMFIESWIFLSRH